MRKLIAAGITTVKELVTKDYGELERLWGRGPPTGKKVADVLAEFPLLSMDLALVPAPKNTTGVGPRTVLVKATLRCLNKAAPILWGGKATAILATFMAETTSGLLVYCWRGNLNQVQAEKALELKFTAEIEALEDQIHCYFTCDEIVGTIVSKTLAHSIPASMFSLKEPTKCLDILSMFRVNDVIADDLDDEDMLEAAAMADTVAVHTAPPSRSSRKVQAETQDESDYDSADFPAIEDIQDVIVAVPPLLPTSGTAKHRSTPSMTASVPKSTPQTQKLTDEKTAAVSKSTTGSMLMAVAPTAAISAQPILKVSKAMAPEVSSAATPAPASAPNEVEREPVQLPNGRWQCNHACTAGNLTKGGKLCSHRCCLEGLDKPRKLKPKPSKATEAKATDKKRKVGQDQGDTDFGSPTASGTFSGPGSTLPKKKAKTRYRAPTDATTPTFVALNRPYTVKPTNNASWAGKDNPNYFDSDEEPIDLVGDADDDNDLPDIATLSARIKEKKESQMKVRGPVQERWEPLTNTEGAPAVGQEVIGQSSKTEEDLQRSFDTEFSDFDQYFDSSDFITHPQDQGLQEESGPDQAFRFGAAGFSSGFAIDKAAEQSSWQLISGSTETLQEMARTRNVGFPVPPFYSMPPSYGVSDNESWLQDTPSLVGGYGMEAHGNSSSPASPPALPYEAQCSQKPSSSHSSSIPADSRWSELFNEAESLQAVTGEFTADPDWLEEFDQGLIDELRDYVNFV
jgi:ATP-dependent DNA helicase HFM1/MER3